MNRWPRSSATCSSAPAPTGPTPSRPALGGLCVTLQLRGPVIVALMLLSVLRGWRWWHALVAGQWMAGHRFDTVVSPKLLAARLAVHRLGPRGDAWRFLAMLGLGLSAGSMLARWRASGQRNMAALAVALTMAIGLDFLVLAHQQLPRHSAYARPAMVPGPAGPRIVNVGDGLGYPCILRGYGVIRGYEPMLSYRRDAPTLRRRGQTRLSGRGLDGRGRGPAGPLESQPAGLSGPAGPGGLHQPESGLMVAGNGRRIFADRRCAEPMLPFAARADDTGRLELRIDRRDCGRDPLHLLGAGLWLWRGGDAFRRDTPAPPVPDQDEKSRNIGSNSTAGDSAEPDRPCMIHMSWPKV